MSGDTFGRSPLHRALVDAVIEYIHRHRDELRELLIPGGMVPKRLGGTGNQSGQATPSAHAGTHATAGSDPVSPASIGAEPALGNPSTTGYVLSSTTAGVRSWVAQSGGGATTRWVPLTNGLESAPEIVFANGDVVLVEEPV